MPISESHPLGRDAALEALRLDDTLSDVSLAAIIADHYWDWAEAERHYKRAIELAPNDVTALRYYSFHLGYTGRAREGLPIAERAASLDPVSPNVQMNVGVMLNFAGRFDEAIIRLEPALELDPGFSFAYAMLGLSYLGKGMPERAVTALEKARAVARPRPNVIATRFSLAPSRSRSAHGPLLRRSTRGRRNARTGIELSSLATSTTHAAGSLAPAHRPASRG